MRKPLFAAAAVLVLAVGGGVGFALFERHERGGLVTQSGQACDGKDQPVPAAPTALPFGLPATDGEVVLNVTSQGSTTVAFARVDGGRDRIVEVRDDVLADLTAAGYTVVGTDQEPGYEAEAEVTGPREGTIKVSPLCSGLLEVRYALR